MTIGHSSVSIYYTLIQICVTIVIIACHFTSLIIRVHPPPHSGVATAAVDQGAGKLLESQSKAQTKTRNRRGVPLNGNNK